MSPVELSHLHHHRGKYLLSRRQKVSFLFHPTLTLKTKESDFESLKKKIGGVKNKKDQSAILYSKRLALKLMQLNTSKIGNSNRFYDPIFRRYSTISCLISKNVKYGHKCFPWAIFNNFQSNNVSTTIFWSDVFLFLCYLLNKLKQKLVVTNFTPGSCPNHIIKRGKLPLVTEITPETGGEMKHLSGEIRHFYAKWIMSLNESWYDKTFR